MSLISSLSRGFYGVRADVGGAPAPWDDYWYSSVGSPSVSGMRVSADTVKRLSTVVAAVTARGRALGTMPCFIYTDLAGGGKTMVKKHPLFRIIHERPNDLQTAYEFYQMQNAHVDLRGNSYCEIEVSSRGVISQLWPMHPDRVRVEQLRSGKLRYIYNDPLTNSTRALLQEEVFHVRDWADSAAVGQSRISLGMDVFGVALAQQDYSGKYLKNDASAGIFVTGASFKSKAEEEEYIRAMQEAGTGDKRHRVRVLPPGVDIKSLGVTPVDMQLLDATKASAVSICTLFNLLPHLIGVDTGKSATYASVEQFNLMHAQQCVLPIAVMWEQAIQRDLVADDRFYAKFSLASLLRGDYATRTAGYAVAVEHGWMSPDDVRELEDMNPIAGGIGKQYFRPLNWTTLDAPIAPIRPAGSAQSDPDSEDDGTDSDEIGSGGDSGDPSEDVDGQKARMKCSLELMAHGVAARCVRRETNAVRKLIQQCERMERDSSHIIAFYGEHARFVADALHLKPLPALKSGQACEARKSELIRMMHEELYAEARVWIERIAATETQRLAALAVEGVL